MFNDIHLSNSLYPESRLFKPTRMEVRSTGMAVKRIKERLQAPVPVTAEDEEHARRWKIPPRSTMHDGFSCALSDWVQEVFDARWRRVVQGQHAHCWTTSRKNATARWRDAPNSYCSDGHPYYAEGAMTKFREEFEIIKPLCVLSFPNGGPVRVALERYVQGARGNVWGLHTRNAFFRVVAGTDTPWDQGDTTSGVVYAELQRLIDKLRQ